MKFKIVLSKQGKEIFKGGNVKVMKKMLISFTADNMRKAIKFFDLKLLESLGSASESAFKVIEVI